MIRNPLARTRPDAPSRRRGRRPQVEPLEGRLLLNAGDLDASFGGTGQVLTQLGQMTMSEGLAVQPDLKTVVTGIESQSSLGGVYAWNLVLARYNPDGSLDATFGSGGEVVLVTNTARDSFSIHDAPVAIQPDGKIVVATDIATNSSGGLSSCDMLVLRFNADGSLDTSFGQGGQVDIHLAEGMCAAHGVAILGGGQIVVAGTRPGQYSGPAFVVARLTSSGALDTTFGPGGRGYNYTAMGNGTGGDSVDALGVDASGDLVLGGKWYNASAGVTNDRVVRYTPGGLIDTSFANQGVLDLPFGATRGIQGVGFQSNGQIIVGFNSYNGVGTGGIARLNPNGTVDTTFGNGGYFLAPNGASNVAIAVQPDDKVLFVENIFDSAGTSYGNLVDRLLPGGGLDPSFGTGGTVVMTEPNVGSPDAIVAKPDGKITGGWTAAQNGVVGLGTFRLLGDPATTGQVVVTQQPPASLSAGTPFGLTVAVEDGSGNVESSYNGTLTVSLGSNPGGATLGGTLTATASQGVATFSGLTLTRAASGYALLVSGSTLASATTTAVAVTPLAASQVAVTQQPPASVTAGSGFGLVASLEDVYGNVITSATNTVSVALAGNPGGATLGETLSVAASNGVATFSGLTLTKAAAGYTLSVTSGGLTGSTTSGLTVTPAAATQLVIVTPPPSSVTLNASFGLVLAIEDAYGNVVTSASNSVTVAFAINPTNAKLGGTTAVKAKNGYVTFSGLSINKRGSGYTLKLTGCGLAGATTGPIQVT